MVPRPMMYGCGTYKRDTENEVTLKTVPQKKSSHLPVTSEVLNRELHLLEKAH